MKFFTLLIFLTSAISLAKESTDTRFYKSTPEQNTFVVDVSPQMIVSSKDRKAVMVEVDVKASQELPFFIEVGTIDKNGKSAACEIPVNGLSSDIRFPCYLELTAPTNFYVDIYKESPFESKTPVIPLLSCINSSTEGCTGQYSISVK